MLDYQRVLGGGGTNMSYFLPLNLGKMIKLLRSICFKHRLKPLRTREPPVEMVLPSQSHHSTGAVKMNVHGLKPPPGNIL